MIHIPLLPTQGGFCILGASPGRSFRSPPGWRSTVNSVHKIVDLKETNTLISRPDAVPVDGLPDVAHG